MEQNSLNMKRYFISKNNPKEKIQIVSKNPAGLYSYMKKNDPTIYYTSELNPDWVEISETDYLTDKKPYLKPEITFYSTKINWVYILDYSIGKIYEISSKSVVDENNISEILSKYGLKESDCSWMVTDHKVTMKTLSAISEVGGTHYSSEIQPWDFIATNKLGFDEGNIIKYICRHQKKNGAEDIKKAITYCEHILKTQYNDTYRKEQNN